MLVVLGDPFPGPKNTSCPTCQVHGFHSDVVGWSDRYGSDDVGLVEMFVMISVGWYV